MKDKFLNYDISKQLKEIGFDDSCSATFNLITKKFDLIYSKERKNSTYPDIIAVPTIQQAIDYFNETHNLEIMVKSWIESKEIIYMYSVNKLGSPSNYDNKFKTKSEATNLAILKAIEIIKNKQK